MAAGRAWAGILRKLALVVPTLSSPARSPPAASSTIDAPTQMRADMLAPPAIGGAMAAGAREAPGGDEGEEVLAAGLHRRDGAARQDHQLARDVVGVRQVDADLALQAQLAQVLAGDEADEL